MVMVGLMITVMRICEACAASAMRDALDSRVQRRETLAVRRDSE